jgi:hypothetical protein
MVGGVVLQEVDPTAVLVGEGLAFGDPLPSERDEIAVLEETDEVRSTLVRRVYDSITAQRIADLAVLRLDGAAFFDRTALDRWVRAFAEELGGGPVRTVRIGGEPVLRSFDGDRGVLAWRRGDALTILRGEPSEVEAVASAILGGIAAGETPRVEPATPLVSLAPDAAFVAVPGVEFVAFPPFSEELPPNPPLFAGQLLTEGRIGVVGGERRATVWSILTDAATYPTLESLEPAVAALVSERTGAGTETQELGDRLVISADGTTSARAFVHGNLVVLVEGPDPAQIEAITTAWVNAL